MFLRYHDSKSKYDREKSVHMMQNIVRYPFFSMGGGDNQVRSAVERRSRTEMLGDM